MAEIFDLPEGATCALCHRPLRGYVMRDARHQYMCGEHKGSVRVCRFCDRGFLPGGGVGVLDRCPLCVSRAVGDQAEADRRYRVLLGWFRLHRLELPNPPPPIELRDRMPNDCRGVGMLGFAERHSRLSGGWYTSRIVMMVGLPIEAFFTVLVHELAHVWLTHAGFDFPEKVTEGLCDWLAHAFTVQFATPDAAYQARRIENREDPIYGDGFRGFRTFAAGAGPAELPRLVRALSANPALVRSLN